MKWNIKPPKFTAKPCLVTKENKEEEVEKLFSYLEGCIDYNFERQLQKCFKTSKKDDAGQETFSWL